MQARGAAGSWWGLDLLLRVMEVAAAVTQAALGAGGMQAASLCLFLPSSPVSGGFVDSPDVAVPPGLWDMAVDPPPLFADCQMHLPVPHTYRVQVSSPWPLCCSHGTGCSAACAGVTAPGSGLCSAQR